MADLTALLDTADCSSPSCTNEADAPDGLCRRCRANGAPTPTPTGRGALAHLMHDDHEKEAPMDRVIGPVRGCKIDGCTNPDAGKRGSWVGLCDHHISVEGSRRQRLRHSRAKPPASAKATRQSRSPRHAPTLTATSSNAVELLVETSSSTEAPPGRLTQLAQAADAAHHAYRQALAELRAAVEAA